MTRINDPTCAETRKIADDVLLMSFPMRALGIDFRRNATLLRLRDGRLVIHSTAPFSERDLGVIRDFGEPAWLVDATLMHDTFAKKGRAALLGSSYLAPPGFAKQTGISTESLFPPPSDWVGEIDVLRIEGIRTNEHALFHRQSRMLVVADLFFSFPETIRGWPRFFARHIMRLPRLFGVSVFFRRLMIRDRQAFADSMNVLLAWNFERVVVAHWEPVEKDAKRTVEQALRDGGFLLN
jgi:hypothetical protein